MTAVTPPAMARIDALITWYETHKPNAGQRIPVCVSPLQLARMLSYPLPAVFPPGYTVPTEFHYRGRVLIAMGERS